MSHFDLASVLLLKKIKNKQIFKSMSTELQLPRLGNYAS